MFRTKRSKERARRRGRFLARRWTSEIASDIATRPLVVGTDGLPPYSRGILGLLFRINANGTRDLLSHNYRVESAWGA